jgi:hypothetical protein
VHNLAYSIRDAKGDRAAIAAAFAAATTDARTRYLDAHAAYREMCAVALLRRAVEAATDAKALIEAASPQLRADLLAVLAVSDVYDRAMSERRLQLAWLNANPLRLPAIKDYYSFSTAAFVNDWGVTSDPRRVAKGSTLIPFLLFPKQFELIDFMVDRFRGGEPGVIVKSREVGASYCSCATLVTLAIFNVGFTATVGSATEVKIDHGRANKNTLFYKIREFAENLPEIFRAGYTREKSTYMLASFPDNSSEIIGEAGRNIGRGGRSSIVVLDEAAYLQDSEAIDESLSANSPCIISISSVNGTANSFYTKAMNPNIANMYFRWNDDPRKSPEWYQRQIDIWGTVVVAQELDCDFSASTDRIIIPSTHVTSAIGLAEKVKRDHGLDVETGRWRIAYDPAGEGADRNAIAVMHGPVLMHAESWSGKGDDLLGSVARVFKVCDQYGLTEFEYDADGVGIGIPGHIRALNEDRKLPIRGRPFHGGGELVSPEEYVPGSSARDNTRNEDAFHNLKAQSWFQLSYLFANSHRLATLGGDFDPDECIFLSSDIPELSRLCVELSQPQYKTNSSGKYLVDKKPDSSASPNLGDAIMIATSPRVWPLKISQEVLDATSRRRI